MSRGPSIESCHTAVWHGFDLTLHFKYCRYGCYTDDSQMFLALAASLVNKGRCCVEESTRQYVLAFDPERGYGGTTVKVSRRQGCYGPCAGPSSRCQTLSEYWEDCSKAHSLWKSFQAHASDCIYMMWVLPLLDGTMIVASMLFRSCYVRYSCTVKLNARRSPICHV